MSSAINPAIGSVETRNFRTMFDVLRVRAVEQPERPVFTTIGSPGEAGSTLNFRQLDTGARAIAGALQAASNPGDRVVIACGQGLQFIKALLGCVYAGAVAVPAYPPRKNRWRDRLEAIVSDCRPAVILGDADQLGEAQTLKASTKALSMERIGAEYLDLWREPAIREDSVVLLQYTSGSTASPRGVMVTHKNILSNERCIAEAFQQSAQSIVVSWLPMFHDMGLIGGLLQPLFSGSQCVLLSSLGFLRRPYVWLKTISDFRADTSGAPNFAYDLCVDKITDDELRTLDLSSWRVAFNGSEPVHATTLDRFTRRFESCGFRRSSFFPCYGLAEATLLVSGRKDTPNLKLQRVEGSSHDLVGCGSWMSGQRVVIVDPQSRRPCGPGEIGEIWTAGDSIAAGYWNRPEDTESTFGASVTAHPGIGFLRTGDLGAIIEQQLYIAGRLRDLIIIRGQNYHPEDIEATVKDELKPGADAGCAAVSVELNREERLVVIHEQPTGTQPGDLLSRIQAAVSAGHEIAVFAVVVVRRNSLPRTPTGKIRRQACRDAFLKGMLDVTAEWRETASIPGAGYSEAPKTVREWLVVELSRLLNSAPADIDAESTTVTGLIDSLRAAELAGAAVERFGKLSSMSIFLSDCSVAEMARRIEQSPDRQAPATAMPVQYPLSHAQEALWFIQETNPESATYNIANAIRIDSQLDTSAFRRAIEALVARHESLRSRFRLRSGLPFQEIAQSREFSFVEEDVRAQSNDWILARLAREAKRPFNLSRESPLRVLLLRHEKGHTLLLVVHHIVSDFWSLAIMIREIALFYDAGTRSKTPALPPPARFRDFAVRQRALLEGHAATALQEYWRQRLAGASKLLDFPYDRQPPAEPSYRCGIESFRINTRRTQSLKELARAGRTTLYVSLLTMYQILLNRYTGQNDFLIGSPVLGRSLPEFADSVGYFVNPLVMRAELAGAPTVVEVLERNRRATLEAFDHQEYPISLLARESGSAGRRGGESLFQSMFILHRLNDDTEPGVGRLALREGGVKFRIGSLQCESVALPELVSNFPLTMVMVESDQELFGTVEYHRDLLDESTVRRYVEHFLNLIDSAISNPAQRISELPILRQAEKHQILDEWNDWPAGIPDANVHELVAEQAAANPDRIAATTEDAQITYGELDASANRLADILRREDVGVETPVAVFIDRSLELIVAMLAVLKAGGVYVPIDRSMPSARIQTILRQCRARAVLADRETAGLVPVDFMNPIVVDTALVREPSVGTSRPQTVDRDNLAYILYTSGSTGKPKGAMNTHRALSNRLCWMQKAFGLGDGDAVLQKTPITFDVSVWELLWPLTAGARLVFAAPERHREADYLVHIIRAEGITTTHFVPSQLKVFVSEPGAERCHSLKRVIASGEALPAETAQAFLSRMPAELHNLYGPTEAAIDVTAWRCIATQDRALPIGRPISNARIYVLDIWHEPVPLGTTGEIYIGGIPPARGYVHAPSLTAERFVPDPFGSPGSRCYRTGDHARFRPDGNIVYVGRQDDQVKIRGFRIETGEIEAVLKEFEGVKDAVVVPDKNAALPHDEAQLVAYVVPADPAGSSAAQLKRHLQAKLPAYMIPSAFIFLDAFPLTASGKLDRQNLPSTAAKRPEIEQEYLAPRTPTEAVVAKIWAEVFGFDEIGVYDSFFDLGGHSLLVSAITNRIQEHFEVDIPVRDFFDDPSVAGLSAMIDSQLQ